MSAFADDSLDPDARRHTPAANLLRLGDDADVRADLERMQPARRDAVVGKIAARMWDVARVDGDLDDPGHRAGPGEGLARDVAQASRRRDALADRRRTCIDWYCVASYEGRAATGQCARRDRDPDDRPARRQEAKPVVDAIITGAGRRRKHQRVGDELLLALAASGDPTRSKICSTSRR